MNLVSLLGYQLKEEGKGKTPLTLLQSLHSIAERSRLPLYAARAGSWACDLVSGGAYYSDELCEALGLSPSGNQGVHWLERLHPDDRERAQADLQRAITECLDFEGDYRVLRPDGGVSWMQIRGWVLYDREGRPRQMIGLGLDITERKQREMEYEERLARETSAREAAEAFNRTQHEFLTLVSQELGSTLNEILRWSRIMTSMPVNNETAKRAGAVIERYAKTQERLIEDLIALTLPDNGKLRLDRLQSGAIDAESPGENPGATFAFRLPYSPSTRCGPLDFCHSTSIGVELRLDDAA